MMQQSVRNEQDRRHSRSRFQPRLCALILLLGAVFAGLPALAEAADLAPLRLVGVADGRELSSIESRKGTLVAVSEGYAIPVPRGTRWRLEGELLENKSGMFFAPDFAILTRANHPISAEKRTRTYGVVRLLRRWPWEEAGNYIQAVVVVLWMVDGRMTRVIPVPANTDDGPSDYVKGLVAIELTPEECRGRPVVMLLKEGKWRAADRWFPNPQVDSVFAQLHFQADVDVAGALSGMEGDSLWTRLYQRPLLYMVARCGFVDAIPSALNAGAGKRTTGGVTPLHAAALGGYREVAATLIAAGARGRPLDNDRRSPFDIALYGGHVDLASDLLETAPSPEDRRHAMQLALALGDSAAVQRMLAARGERVFKSLHPDDYSGTLELGDEALVQRLLQLRMRLNDERPLLHAVAGGNPNIVQMLLDAGARVDRTAPDRTSPLMLAAAQGNVAVLEILHRAGADLNAMNKLRESPLGLASRAGHRDAVEFLVNHGATVDSLAARPPRRDPKTRWITDRLRPESDQVFSEDEVLLPPAVKTTPRFEVVRRSEMRTIPMTTSQYATNPFTGETYQTTVTQPVTSYVPAVSVTTWAVASMIVEVDGSVSHAVMVDADSPETWLALDKVIDEYTFEPGELDGRKVRTRITLPIIVSD